MFQFGILLIALLAYLDKKKKLLNFGESQLLF
ncbi:putative holin-like toxin [Leuconostoc suionicum]